MGTRNRDWDSILGFGIEEWELGIRIRGLGSGIGIGDGDRILGLGIMIGDGGLVIEIWDGGSGLDFGIGNGY